MNWKQRCKEPKNKGLEQSVAVELLPNVLKAKALGLTPNERERGGHKGQVIIVIIIVIIIEQR